MRNIYILFILVISVVLAACNKEEQVCIKTDFIGDFIGVTTCSGVTGTGPGVATVIRVTDGNAANEVIVNVDGFIVTVLIDGCKFSGAEKNADVDITFTGSLSGEKLKVKLEGIVFNRALNCESEGERN